VSNLELQAKAEEYVKQRGWDSLLIQAQLEVQHYHAWCKREDFDDTLNIGVENISANVRDINFGSTHKTTTFTCGFFGGVWFELGSATNYWEFGISKIVDLYVDQKKVLSIKYWARHEDPFFDYDWYMASVEEFHLTEKIGLLLSQIYNAIPAKDQRREDKIRLEQESKLVGKFSF